MGRQRLLLKGRKERRMTAEERADLLNDIQTMLIEKDYPLYVGGYEDKGEIIDVILSVDAEPVRHGKWLCSDDIYETAVCSVCNFDTGEPYEYVKKSWNFCPNCGAKMERKEE